MHAARLCPPLLLLPKLDQTLFPASKKHAASALAVRTCGLEACQRKPGWPSRALVRMATSSAIASSSLRCCSRPCWRAFMSACSRARRFSASASGSKKMGLHGGAQGVAQAAPLVTPTISTPAQAHAGGHNAPVHACYAPALTPFQTMPGVSSSAFQRTSHLLQAYRTLPPCSHVRRRWHALRSACLRWRAAQSCPHLPTTSKRGMRRGGQHAQGCVRRRRARRKACTPVDSCW